MGYDNGDIFGKASKRADWTEELIGGLTLSVDYKVLMVVWSLSD